ncbi:probable methyltransferase-like protein 25 [Argopecten irradians]|uniref:LOW QUALITY PROTEIN: probable methyltransferase-like protein 25 n=1 Tax=Argopecten irradians TaxID=31199 RepID=UPI0037141433
MSKMEGENTNGNGCGNPKGLNIKQVQKCIDGVLNTIQSYLPFCNAHSNDFIIDNHWENHIPLEIRTELFAMSDQQLCDLPSRYIDMLTKNIVNEHGTAVSPDLKPATVKTQGNEDTETCHINRDHDRARGHRLPADLESYLRTVCGTNLQSMDVLVDIEYLFSKSGLIKDVLQVKNFMTDKKSHEVDIMTCVCSRLASSTGADVIVDMGSGKGYLSTQLALKCHKTVVGIDAQLVNTKGAIKRAKILTKQWKGLVRNAQELQDTGIVTKKSKKLKKKLKKERMSAMLAEGEDTNTSVVTEEALETPDQEDFDGLGAIFGGDSDVALDVSLHCTKGDVKQSTCKNMQSKTDTEKLSQNPPLSEVKDSSAIEIEKMSSLTLEKATHDVNYSFQNNGNPSSDSRSKSSLPAEFLQASGPQVEVLHTGYKVTQKKRQNSSVKLPTCEPVLPYIPLTLFVDTTMDLMEVVSKALTDHSLTTHQPTHNQGETTYQSGHNQGEPTHQPGHNQGETTHQPGHNQGETTYHSGHNQGETTYHSGHNQGETTHQLGHNQGETTNQPDHNQGETTSQPGHNQGETTHQPGHNQGETMLMLTGLHTCGALGSSMLELFVNNPSVRVLCGVGCCYHYMRETFSPHNQQLEDDLPVGFPMSRYLNDQEVYIGRKARNFASQSLYRQAQETELSFATFPRCLLQKILLDVVGHIDPDWKGLRGLGGMTSDMYQYVTKAFTKLGLPTDKITPEFVETYCERYGDDKRKLEAFRQLKSVLAPTIEALVLLDRACYLLEQECVGEVYLVQMFDPVISPRCYGIVSIKKS